MVEATTLVLSPSGTFSTDSLKIHVLVVTPGDDFILLFSSLTMRQNIQFPLRENLVLSVQ